jgi:hypothetical protein
MRLGAMVIVSVLALSIVGCEAVGNDCIESTCDEWCQDTGWLNGTCDGEWCDCDMGGGDGDGDADCHRNDDCDIVSICVAGRCEYVYDVDYYIVAVEARYIPLVNDAGVEWDLWGHPDPYLHITVGDQEASTSVVTDSQNPVWDEPLGPFALDVTTLVSWEILDDDYPLGSEIITWMDYYIFSMDDLRSGEFSTSNGTIRVRLGLEPY